MYTLRTPEGEQKYQDYIKSGGLKNGCPLCHIPSIKEFNYWRIVPNEYPYDTIADRHDMLIPKEHKTEHDLNEDEKRELLELKDTYINDTYRYVMEATHKHKSIPPHFHLHLITLKEQS